MARQEEQSRRARGLITNYGVMEDREAVRWLHSELCQRAGQHHPDIRLAERARSIFHWSSVELFCVADNSGKRFSCRPGCLFLLSAFSDSFHRFQ